MDQDSSEVSHLPSLIQGEVKRVTFHNPANGYSVLQVYLADKRGDLTVVGTALGVQTGSFIVARGIYKKHQKFGMQFTAQNITETIPATPEGLERYLSSGMIKGVGEKTAKRLIEHFGVETMEILATEPAKVSKIPGISKKKALEIQEVVASKRDTHDIMRFLVEHNISTGLAGRIFELYGRKSIEEISKDPYRLARQLRGVGFLTSDSIALNLGFAPNSLERIKAGLYYALEKGADDGHTHLPLKFLLDKTRSLLQIDDTEDLEAPLKILIEENFVHLTDDNKVFMQRLYKAESFCAEFIAKRCEPFAEPVITPNKIQFAIKQAETSLGLNFSAEQKYAVEIAGQYPLLVVTGGPGCGKTTVVRGLVQVFKDAGLTIKLAAPTGRAAQRLSQVCDMPASTIHRLLKYDPFKQSFQFSINDPLIADCVIVDESSMLDVQLAKDLFSAIGKKTVLILVGDKDQLPSVGAGRVFADIIGISEVKTISLTQLFRRDETSSITSVAHQINSGIIPNIPEPDGVTKCDTYFLPRKTPEESAKLIEGLVSQQIPKKFGFKPSEIMVLTPSNRGPLGTIELNKSLQRTINPPHPQIVEEEIISGENVFRLGDRVTQRVNNYQIDEAGVFNGDTGKVIGTLEGKSGVLVELWDGRRVKYDRKDLHQLSLGYSLTVHRSQGSEIPCVVLALHDSHFILLERQLIYTAVTRAKKLLIIVGSRRALALACKKTRASQRCTELQGMVRKLPV